MSAEHDALLETLKRVAVALKRAQIPFALAGSYAVYARGGPHPEHDVDFFLQEQDVAEAAHALGELGLRIVHPPEDWLIKAYDSDRLVDLIFRANGRPVTREMLEQAEEMDVASVRMSVLDATDLMVGRLLAFSHHFCDFSAVLPMTRAMREQVDWDRVRQQTADSPFAYSFLVLAERLGLVPEHTELTSIRGDRKPRAVPEVEHAR
ncbi:hypothetical protein C3Y87_18130 [Carbonactinospora thermoautotrophica]|uniref:Nucleotidyltransferase family protein n=1 Tax=Carbonactinospora thermoautotrophica TaxID=1469144 RepID=A0A132MZ50_9ACTN|nr:nucleotidyltransferase [Carbonactinospora thermoautotrophica]KWX03093.1 hypothetical protein LI90_4143 [Carbonactinospora thermoautotrophica]MCX9193285.1 hypothetical protein [Carbonactinospora thermoautotrophica]